jgi:hypothetical protein
MEIASGAIEAGVDTDEFIVRLADAGIWNRPWTVQLASVGSSANVTASVGKKAAGPWSAVLDVTDEDGSQNSDVNSDWYLRIKVESGTTDSGFKAIVG